MNASLLSAHINNLSTNPLYQIIIDQLDVGVLITDESGYIRYINKAYTAIVDIIGNDIIGKKVQDVRRGSRLPEVLQTGKPLLGIRRTVNRIDYVVDINPVFIDNKIAGALSIVRDITHIEQMNKKLDVYSHRVAELKNKVKDIHRAYFSFDDIIGTSNEITVAKNTAKRIAASNVAVLILGESGTGKERFAHAIHQASMRSNAPFVAINCAAFPPDLLISEIFGYESGAFTGASKGGKLGLFEIAHTGTLFLDEIGDMDFELQSKLLRVIETGEFMRLGGTKPTRVDVRIISATNKNLESLIGCNKFREDLYYRLNVAPIKMPPLRKRLTDIPVLANYFISNINNKQKKGYTISADALKMLCNYNYPGNIRELINILEFAASTCDNDQIMAEDLPVIAKIKSTTSDVKRTLSSATKISEKDAIIQALEQFGQTVSGKREAAKHLDISLATLYNKIRQYDI